MNSLDAFILIPIAIGFIFGLFRGLVKEVASLAAIVIGIYGAKLFSPLVSDWLMQSLDLSPKVAIPAAYMLAFIILAVVLLLAAHLLDKLFSSMALGGINKLLGGVFGALKYALIVSVVLNVADALDSRFAFLNKESREKSISFEPVLKLAPKLWDETQKQDADEKADFQKA